MDQNEQLVKSYLQRISNILLINGGYLGNPGLYSGEMGLVLFFFRYARFIENELYSNYALNLFKKVTNSIYVNTPINYKQGITGIGSAIEYLVQEGYLDFDTDELLEDFDDRIFSIPNLHPLSYEEIEGIGNYTIWRIKGSKSKKDFLLNTLLPPFIDGMDEWLTGRNLSNQTVSCISEMIRDENRMNLYDQPTFSISNRFDCWHNQYYPFTTTSEQLMERFIKKDIFNPNNLKFGFPDGLAATGMTFITELTDDISWISLFPNDDISQNNESIPV